MIKNSGSEQQDPGRAKDKTIEEIVSASNPLPPEIEQMPEEETCCKFCGVSYLIHREVTRLKSLLQNFEKFHESYLVFYKEDKPKLTRQLADQQSMSRQLQIRVKELEGMYRDSLSENETLKASLQSLEKSLVQKKRSFQALKPVLLARLSSMEGQVSNFSHLVLNLKDEVKMGLSEGRRNLNRLKNLCQQQDGQLELLTSNLKEKTDELEKHKTMVASLNEALLISKGDCEDLNRALKEKQRSFALLSDKLRDARSEIASMGDMKANDSRTISDLNHKIQDIQEESLVKQDKVRELTTLLLEDKRKYANTIASLEEAKRQLETELDASEAKLKSIVEDMKAKDELAQSAIEARNSQEQVEQLARERSKLLQEKKEMIAAHQCRIKELQEAFVLKLQKSSSEAVSESLEKYRLEALKEKEKSLSEQRDYLNRKFDTERNALQDRLNILKRQMEQQACKHNDELESQRLEMLVNQDKTQQLFANERRELAKEIARITEEREKLREAIAKIMDKSLTEPADDGPQVSALKKSLLRKDEEIRMLKETVNRECEERVELLSKIELLSVNK